MTFDTRCKVCSSGHCLMPSWQLTEEQHLPATESLPESKFQTLNQQKSKDNKDHRKQSQPRNNLETPMQNHWLVILLFSVSVTWQEPEGRADHRRLEELGGLIHFEGGRKLHEVLVASEATTPRPTVQGYIFTLKEHWTIGKQWFNRILWDLPSTYVCWFINFRNPSKYTDILQQEPELLELQTNLANYPAPPCSELHICSVSHWGMGFSDSLGVSINMTNATHREISKTQFKPKMTVLVWWYPTSLTLTYLSSLRIHTSTRWNTTSCDINWSQHQYMSIPFNQQNTIWPKGKFTQISRPVLPPLSCSFCSPQLQVGNVVHHQTTWQPSIKYSYIYQQKSS